MRASFPAQALAVAWARGAPRALTGLGPILLDGLKCTVNEVYGFSIISEAFLIHVLNELVYSLISIQFCTNVSIV